jgi:hypothetical protein
LARLDELIATYENEGQKLPKQQLLALVKDELNIAVLELVLKP